MRNYHQGKFIPRNPQKYVGDVTNIFARSSWERKMMIFFDTNPNILKWNSEEVVIPYISQVDNRQHRYFVDFSVLFRTKTGEIKKALVEVKPLAQTKPPVKPKRTTKRYIEEVQTYIVNQNKWEAATKYAKQKGFDFIVLTEKDIFGK